MPIGCLTVNIMCSRNGVDSEKVEDGWIDGVIR